MENQITLPQIKVWGNGTVTQILLPQFWTAWDSCHFDRLSFLHFWYIRHETILYLTETVHVKNMLICKMQVLANCHWKKMKIYGMEIV